MQCIAVSSKRVHCLSSSVRVISCVGRGGRGVAYICYYSAVFVCHILFLCALFLVHTLLSTRSAVRVFGDMGWLRCVGSIKLQVSLAEYSLFYRALLQKRRIILSILLTKATPYMHLSCQNRKSTELIQSYYTITQTMP